MTVPATARRAGPYNGNGSTTSFSFSFKTFAAGDLQVTRTSSTGLESVLVLNSDYSVTLNSDQDTSPGGTIAYPITGTALAAGEKLTIVGDLEYEQTTDLLGGGAFNARVIEDTFDRTVIQIQQLEERADRALALPVSASGVDATLPVPASNKVIGWNAAANALVNRDVADFATTLAFANWRSDRFSGNGSAVAFTLSADPGNVNNMDVSIGGVTQVNGIDFTVSGTTLTFTSAPPAGTNNILARYGQALPIGAADAANTTYSPAGTGAVPSNVKRKLDERISAFDFMSAAQIASVQARDMVQDVTAPLQAFFDACRGKRGYLPAGTYKKTAQITLDPQYSYDIEGDGWSSEYSQQGTIIRDTTVCNGLFIYYTLANYPGGPGGPGGGYPNSDNIVRLAKFALRGPDNLTLSPGTQTIGIEGVNTSVATGSGIWMYWMNHLRLEDFWIDGYVADGVYGYRCFSAAFTNVWLIKNSLCGVHLYNTSNNVVFRDCKILANGRVPRPDINSNILIDGAPGYDNLGPNIDTGTDVSYAGQQGVRYSAKDGTLTSIVVSAGVATANITGTNRFSAGHKLAVNGWLPTSVTAGSFQVGAQYTIATLGTTDFTAIGAPTNAVGIVFTATGAGTGTGTATYDLNTRGDAITVTSVTASTIVFPLAVPDGTYDQGALPQNQRTLVVLPYCAGVGVDRIQGCRIAAYSEECSGPGVYVFPEVDSFLVQGGYWLQDTIFVKAGARGGVIQGCAFSGVEAGVYLENPVSAVVGQNTYLTDPVRGSPLSYIGNLPFLDNGSMIVQGMTIGRGADYNIGRYEPGPVQSTAVGVGALVSANTSGGAGQGLQNTAVGYFALNANTAGYNNTAVGRHAALALTTGYQNVAVGNRAMDTGQNLQGCTFVGNTAGSGMTSGSNDTYIGVSAGVKASAGASDGNNTGLGSNALRVDGSQNYRECTVVGGQSVPMSAATGLTNYTALGFDTYSFAASNKVRIGNASVTAAHVQVAWTVTSDARLKRDIRDLDLGLALVNALRPVSYRRIGDDTEELGFLAQEVQAALPRPLGMLHVDPDGTYMLRKDDLIAVLVRSVQELSARVAQLEAKA